MSNALLVQSFSNGFVDGATYYLAPLGAGINSVTVTGEIEIPIRDAGTFSNLFVYAPTNTASVSSTITLHKSRVDTALTVTYEADQTGIKEDTANSVAFAATDEAQWEITIPAEAGTNTLTLTLIGCQFAPDTGTNCVFFRGGNGTATISAASLTTYSGGGSASFTTSEAIHKFRARLAFTAQDFSAFVTTNARTTDTTFTTRKNGAPGNQTVTYSSAQTGYKEDTVNTDSIAVGDDFNFAVTTGTGTGNIVVRHYTCTGINTGGQFVLFSGGGVTLVNGVTVYIGIAGGLGNSATEANYQIYPRFNFTAKELGVMVNTNGNGPVTITVRENGASSGISVTYSAFQTGLKNDSVNTAEIALGSDEIDYEVVTGAGTLPNISWMSVLGETTAVAASASRLSLLGVG